MINKKQKKSSRKLMTNRRNAQQALSMNRAIAGARKEQITQQKNQQAQQMINKSSGRGN